MIQHNLTRETEAACKALRELKSFNGLRIIKAETQSEEDKRSEAEDDGLTPEQIDALINSYACFELELDLASLERGGLDSPYVDSEFLEQKLQNDLKEFLLPFYQNDPHVIPDEINFWGETEIGLRDPEVDATSAKPAEYRPISVEAALEISRHYSKQMVLIVGIDRVHEKTHFATFGETPEDKVQIAQIGDAFSKWLTNSPPVNVYEDFRVVDQAKRAKQIRDLQEFVKAFLAGFQSKPELMIRAKTLLEEQGLAV